MPILDPPEIGEFTNPLTDPPVSSQPPAQFIINADFMTSQGFPLIFDEMNRFGNEANALGVWMGNQTAVVQSLSDAIFNSVNFAGNWNELSGPLNAGAWVQHDNATWVLQQDMSDVTTVEPGTDEAYWVWYFDSIGGISVDMDTLFVSVDNIATPLEMMSDTPEKVVGVEEMWEAATPKALTPGATVTVDMSTGSNFTLTVGQNTTINATNRKPGQPLNIEIVNSGTYTVGFGTMFKFSGGTAPLLDTNGEYLLAGYTRSDNTIVLTAIKNIG